MKISTFAHLGAKIPSQRSLDWPELRDLLTTFTDSQKQLWSPVSYREGAKRGIPGVEFVYALPLDFDDGTDPDDLSGQWNDLGLEFVIHGTWHHCRAKDDHPVLPRWRAVFPLASPVPAEDWPEAYPRLATYLAGTLWDPACKDSSRMHWLPARHKDSPELSIVSKGTPLDPSSGEPIQAEPRKAPTPKPLTSEEDKPGGDYSARGDHRPVLEQAGWTYSKQSGPNEHWIRPGKTKGTGGTWHTGKRLFFPFTSSTDLDPQRGYSLFYLRTHYQHGDDFKDSARALAGEGYGSQVLALVPDLEDVPPPGDEHAPPVHPDAKHIDIGPTVERDHQRKIIRITTDIKPTVDAAEDAIMSMPRRNLYQRSGVLVRIARDSAPAAKGHERPPGAIVIKPAPKAYITEMCSRSATWWSLTKADAAKWKDLDKEEKELKFKELWTKKLPPAWVIECLMERGQWSFPPIMGIISAPTMRLDGSILNKPGYDYETGLLYLPGDVKFPEIKDSPTREDATEALNFLKEPFLDFPFQAQSDISASLCSTMALVCRAAIAGPVPLFAIGATAAGTGKSLLADIVALIGTGRVAPKWSQSQTEDEERKRLFAIALEGDPVLLIDNVTRSLGTGTLDMALTSSSIKDRVLGISGTAEAPFRPVVFATGNNMQVKGDTGRRIVPIDMDAKCERPEMRTGWKHPELITWVKSNRAELVAATLTACRAYAVAGYPSMELRPMGSFEDFARVARSAIVWAGFADPIEGRERLRREGDPELEALRLLMVAWNSCHGSRAMILRDIVEELAEPYGEEAKDLKAAIEASVEGYKRGTMQTKLGYYMRKYKGRVIDGLRIVSGEKESGGIPWAVVPLPVPVVGSRKST